jgi:hypothetical protein
MVSVRLAIDRICDMAIGSPISAVLRNFVAKIVKGEVPSRLPETRGYSKAPS